MHRSTTWRRNLADEIFPAEDRRWALEHIAAGWSLQEVMGDLDMSPEQAYGRARWDEAWRDALYRAQMAGREPADDHGTIRRYHAGCECPECRASTPRNTGVQAWLASKG